MGWQGRLRGVKAERFFAELPPEVREGLRLHHVSIWRDNQRAWVCCIDEEGRSVTLYVHRASGEVMGRYVYPAPLGGDPRRWSLY